MAKSALKTASVLAFERKLDVSDGLFSAGCWGDREQGDRWPGISVREKSVRGTISNRLKATEQDPAKLNAKIENPNLQTVDVATLPNDADTLRVRFTLRVLSDAGRPSACNNPEYQQKLQQAVADYVQNPGFDELGRRYAYNIACGRFLWRNRLGAELIEVCVRQISQGDTVMDWVFNGQNFPLRQFDTTDHPAVEQLGTVIVQGLNQNQSFVFFEVIAYARMGDGQEVFPSQELILDGRENKSKTLYSVGDVAAMHSQKIGNALRTIDTWYPKDEDEDLGPIAIEPYGSVTSQGRAYRQPRAKKDFYSLLDTWVLHDNKPEVDDQHFVMANLIRGGVFGEKE